MPNVLPIGVADVFDPVFEDDVLKITAKPSGVLNNDIDPDDNKLAAVLDVATENPLFDINTNGTFTYDARYHGVLYVDENGELIDVSEVAGGDDTTLTNGFDSLAATASITDQFTYYVYDGQDISLVPVTATITILGVNDDPVAANDDAGEISEGGTLADIDVLANDTDVDIYPTPDVLTVNSLSDVDDGNGGASAGNGTATLTTDAGGTVTIEGDGELNYVAAADFFGIDTFEYTVGDGNGGSDTGTVRVTVLPANADPTAMDDIYIVGEDDGATALGSTLVNDMDPDGEDLLGAQLSDPIATALRQVDSPATADSDNGGATGILVDFDTDGNFIYNPNGEFESLGEGEKAYVAFDYVAFDAEGNPSEATVVIEVNGANDPLFGNIPVKNALVYESGLADGSQDGDDNVAPIGDTITRTFDFTGDLTGLSASDPEGDTIFLVRIDGSGEGVLLTGAGDTIADDHGTFTLLDDFDNGDGTAGSDGLVDGVSYTLNDNATHSDVAGHNGDVFDLLNLGFTDGTLNAGETAYVLDFTGSGGTNNVTGAQVEVIDDIPLLGTGPDAIAGDGFEDKTVAFMAGMTATDDFTFIEGADGAALVLDGVPQTFTVEADGVPGNTAGDITVSSTVIQQGDDILVEGRDGDGDLWYTLFIDANGGAGADEGSWLYTQVQEPPEVIIPVDFSSVKAGGPQETLTASNVTFDGFSYNLGSIDDDYSDTAPPPTPTLKSLKTDSAGGSDDVNPNNAGGIGVGNGNIEQAEGLLIDVSATTIPPTGIQFLVEGVGGGIALETLIWEAYDDTGTLVDYGEITLNLRNTLGAQEVTIQPDAAFDELYVGTTDTMDGNDKFRINQINLIATAESDDYILPFQLVADEGAVDGDITPVADFTVEVDGLTDTDILVPLDDFGNYV